MIPIPSGSVRRRLFTLMLSACACSASSPGAAASEAAGPEYGHRIWTKVDGLPDNAIEDLEQTRDGYLWMATRSGLTRFDGRRFVTFNRHTTEVLQTDACFSLAEDTQGNLWIGTAGALVRYENGRFQRMLSEQAMPGRRPNAFRVTTRRAGGVWVVGKDFGYHTGAGYVRLETAARVRCVLDASSEVLVGTETGLMRLDPHTGVLQPTGGSNLLNSRILAMHQDEAGLRWMLARPPGDDSHVRLCREVNGLWQPVEDTKFLTMEPCFLRSDRSGMIWFPAEMPRRHNGRRIEGVEAPIGMQGAHFISFEEDDRGNLWLGTQDRGLLLLRREEMRMHTASSGLTHSAVNSVCEAADGALWIGTKQGVTRWDRSAGRLGLPGEHVRHFFGQWMPDAPNRVCSIINGAPGEVLVGTHGGGVLRFQQEIIGSYQVPGADSSAHDDNKVNVVHLGRNGWIWVGTVRRLLLFAEDRIFHWVRLPGEPANLRDLTYQELRVSLRVRTLFEDESDVLWVGTDGQGLFRLDVKGLERRLMASAPQSVTTVPVDVLSRDQGIAGEMVWAFHPDELDAGVIWVGTDNGLNRLERGRVTHYSRREGLPSAEIREILQDVQGDFWLGTANGICRIEREALNQVARGARSRVVCAVYRMRNGTTIPEVSGWQGQPAGCRTADGTLWFATAGGLLEIPPFAQDLSRAPVSHVERIRSNGRIVYGEKDLADDEIAAGPPGPETAHSFWIPAPESGVRLPPGAGRFLEFQFAAMELAAPGAIQFRHRLVGLSDDWHDSGPRRSVRYANLGPGRYEFQVEASSREGLWNGRPASVRLHIAPHLHERKSAQAAAGSGLLLLGYGWHRRRLSRLRRFQTLRHQCAVEDERRRIARDIHDEIGSDLTRIVWLCRKAESRDAAGAFDPSKVAELARQVVSRFGNLVWVTNPRFDTLPDLVSHLRATTAAQLEGTGIEYRFKVPEVIPERPLSGRVRRTLLLIVTEAVHNVLKHAAATRIELDLGVSREALWLEVRDDGPPQARIDETPTGNGLRNMRNRVAELNGTISIRPRTHGGVVIALTVPLAGGDGDSRS